MVFAGNKCSIMVAFTVWNMTFLKKRVKLTQFLLKKEVTNQVQRSIQSEEKDCRDHGNFQPEESPLENSKSL